MSYTKQVFENDTVLYASDLNTMSEGIESKQDNLISGVNIKTINGISLLGSGNISLRDLSPLSTVEGYYINTSGLANTAMEGKYNIDTYDVTGLTKIKIKARIGGTACCCWLDASNVRTLALVGNSNAGLNVNTVLTVPSGITLLEVSYSTSQPCTVSMDLADDSGSGDGGAATTTQLTGKKVGICGDSIAANGGFFSTFVSEMGCSSGKNVAVGGWVFGEDTTDGAYPNDATHGIYRQVPNLTGDESLIILWAGTNDFGHGHEIGEPFIINESTGVREPVTDPTTFCGGIHKCIQLLYEKYTYIPIILCTPLQRVIGGSSENYPENSRDKNHRGYYITEYRDAMRKIGEYYSIPIFEAGQLTNLDPNNQYIYDTYMPDGLHPNAEGHKIIGKALAKFVKNNLYLPKL